MALDIISTINLDLKRPNTETVYAVQYDTAGRIKAQLTNDGEAWHVPTSAGGMVSFRKSDNIGGFYDTTELGEVAVSVDENDNSVIYIALDAQTTITATPLDHPVQMQINFYNSQGKRLSTFAFYLRVQASVLFDGDQDERPVASEWTFRILTGALGQTIKNQEEAIKWMEDNIRTQEGYVVDDTLKVEGAAGDAKKIGELFEEIVKISDSMPGYFPTTDTARVGSTKYYTRSGTAPNYVYTEFTGATFATGVTYYEYSPWNRIWIDPDDNNVAIPTMDEFDEVKSAFDDLETTLTDEGIIAPIYKLQTVFNNSTVYSTGTIIDGSLGYNVYVFYVPAGTTVVVTGGNNYGLYAEVPVKNTTVSVDGIRHVGSLSATPITMPSGANYLAIANSAEPTVDAIDTTIITDRVELLEGKAEDLEDRYTVVEPENFITLSQNNLYGIPSDMEVSTSNGTVTFSYPYASGNKSNFGIIFDELVNGKSYTLNFDVTSGGLAAVSNIRVVTLNSNKSLASLLGYVTNTGSHYSCTFIVNSTADEPYIALMLGMARSVSTTATLSNISVIATGETEYTKLKNTYVRDLGQESFSDDVNEILNSTSKSVKITIANSDKIGYISNSFLNGYTIRGHHAIENISMFSDYLHYNYGKSGDNAVSALIRIENDSSWLGAVPISEWGMKYAVIAMEDNDKAMYQINSATYYQNFKKLCEAVRALGAVPILGTEHDVSGAYYGLESLAREQGIMFMNWGKVANALKCGYFPPFWNNNHPATRTAWLWSNGMKQYLDTLPRPEKSIKLFRVRDGVDTTDLDNLVYNDTIERAERFAEIHVGQKALTIATEKYFDRMDVSGPAWEDVNDEYQTLQSGTDGVSFGSFALVECVTPYEGNGLTNLTISIESTGVTKAYIKKNKSITLPYNWATYIAFGVTAGAESLTPNSTFQITGGVFDSSLIGTYTVDSVVNGIVITKTSSSRKTTSGTDAPVCSVSGVVLAGSYTSMSSDYLANYMKPIGEYIEITEFDNDGVTDLSDYLSNCVDYDKVSILLTGTSIDIEKIEFNAIGNGEKARVGKALVQRIDGTSILTDTLLDDNTAWNGINDVPKYTPVASTKSSSTIEALPGVTTVRILDDGDSIYQSINTSWLNTNALKTYKLQIRVIARYFPEYIDTDAKWAASEVTETSYDCARLAITIGDNDVCARAEVGAYWNEYIFDVDYISGDKINVACENKSLQIAKVECELIN